VHLTVVQHSSREELGRADTAEQRAGLGTIMGLPEAVAGVAGEET